MQGRPGKDNEAWDKFSSDRLASVNGTGKRRTLPHRPSTMPHLDTPPATTRVARPQRQAPPPKNWRRRFFILLGVFIVCGLLAWGFGYAIVNLFAAVSSSAGASNTASDFLTAISSRNYDQAYNDLDDTITIQLTKDDFKQQAARDDSCYGSVTSFNEVANSATAQGNTQSFTYSITRVKGSASKSYQLHLTLQKDTNNQWFITQYGNTNDLGPSQTRCSS